MGVGDDVLGPTVVLLASDCKVKVDSSASTLPSWSALPAAAVIGVVLVSIPSFSFLYLASDMELNKYKLQILNTLSASHTWLHAHDDRLEHS